jgi:sporulation protein YqfD
MNFWRSLSGMVEVRLTSADLPGALRSINQANIEIFSACQIGELTLEFTVHRGDFKRVRRLARKRGERLDLMSRDGIYWTLRRFAARPVLMFGFGLILTLTLYLPGQIYFVEVEGNSTIPTAQILDTAAQCGIGFGADRRSVRSEQMKNTLLQAMPDLQWAGINTYGCRAVISVKERPKEETQSMKGGVSSIVATRDGIVKEIIVQSGNKVCAPGQAVKAGQVLISGYTDCGICIRATRAQGEIYAQTQRNLSVILPLEYDGKVTIQGQTKKYSLLIGKKLINFFKDSGISHTSCDKMYSVDYITLPGNLQLPIALVTENMISYETADGTLDQEVAESRVKVFSHKYLTDTMVAGQIHQKFESIQHSDSACILLGRYACLEMIGKTRLEENIHDYGQSD